MRRRVVIIGGGISGLAAAYYLRATAPEIDILLLESGKRLGGVIQTTKQDGFLIESAADSFITTSTAAVDLCTRLGLGDDGGMQIEIGADSGRISCDGTFAALAPVVDASA
jgi:oxygen-dependent protoporphyrinogen oxidase